MYRLIYRREIIGVGNLRMGVRGGGEGGQGLPPAVIIEWAEGELELVHTQCLHTICSIAAHILLSKYWTVNDILSLRLRWTLPPTVG